MWAALVGLATEGLGLFSAHKGAEAAAVEHETAKAQAEAEIAKAEAYAEVELAKLEADAKASAAWAESLKTVTIGVAAIGGVLGTGYFIYREMK